MGAGSEKLAQPLADLRYRLRPRYADNVEALRAGGFGERLFDGRRSQKSRFA